MMLYTKMVFDTKMFFCFLFLKVCVILNLLLWVWVCNWATRRVKKTQEKLDLDLRLAVEKGDLTEMLKLLKKGANPNKIDNEGYNTLHLAVERGHSKLLHHLVKYGADLEREGIVYGYKPLHLIVSGNNEMECLEELLKCGVDLKSTDCMGNTLLQLMVKVHPNGVSFIEKLLSLGMNPHTFDIIGNNCLHNLAASHFGEDKNVEFLAEIFIEKGTDLNCSNLTISETPLLVACRRGKAFLVDLLLRRGAKIDVVDKDGLNAFRKVRTTENDVIGILIKHFVLKKHRGERVSHFIGQEVELNGQRSKLYDDYMEDLEGLRREVAQSFHVSYSDILCKNNHRVAKYFRNTEVRDKLINYENYGKTNYIKEITYEIGNVDQIVKKNEILFTTVNQLFDGRLPHLCVDKITSYLSADDFF